MIEYLIVLNTIVVLWVLFMVNKINRNAQKPPVIHFKRPGPTVKPSIPTIPNRDYSRYIEVTSKDSAEREVYDTEEKRVRTWREVKESGNEH